MTDTVGTASIELGVDSSAVDAGLGKIDAGIQRTGRNLDNLGKQGTAALDGIGAGGAVAAGKVDATTKNLIGTIQRATVAMQSGAKGTAEYYAALANTRGANAATLKPYLDQLDSVAKKAAAAAEAQRSLADSNKFLEGLRTQADSIGKTASELLAMRAAQLGVSESAAPMIERLRAAEEAANGTGTAFSKSKIALAAFAAVVAGGALFVGMVKGAVDAADSLNDLSKSTGVAVGDLAGLKLAAQQSGGDLEGIAASINKLSVNIGKDAERFAKLGITAKDPIEAFKQLADVFVVIDDPQTRAALGAEVLGKSWSSAAPLLAEGGKRIGEMVARGKDLSGATQAMSDESDKFNDTLSELNATLDGFKMKVASELLPGLNKAAEAIKKAYEESDKLGAAWATLGAVGAFAFTDEFSSATVKIENLRKEVSQLEQDLDLSKSAPAVGYVGRLLFGDSTEALEAKLSSARAQIKSLQEQANPAKKPGESAAEQAAEAAKKKAAAAAVAELLKQNEEARKKAADAVQKEADAYANLTASISERIAATSREAAGLAPLTESQKLQVALLEQLRTGKLHLTAEHKKEYEAQIKSLGVAEAVVASAKRAAQGALEVDKIYKAAAAASAKSIEAAEQEADRNVELARTFGMTKAAIEELGLARLEEQLAQRDSMGLTLDEIETLEKLIAAKRRNVQAVGSLDTQAIARKANEDLLADWTRTVEKYDDVFRQGFADMLNRGEDGWKSFTKSLVTTFKTTVADQIYKMFAQPFVVKMVASLLGVTGGPTVSSIAQAASGNSSGVGQVGSLLQTGKGIYDAISTGFSGVAASVGSGIASLGTTLGSTTLQGFGMGVGSAGTSAAGQAYLAENVAGYSSGAIAGAAATVAAGILGGVYGGRALSGGYSAVGGSGNSLTNSGTAIGTGVGYYVGGPVGAGIGALLGGVIGGALNHAFGHKAPEVTDARIHGNLTGDNQFSGDTTTTWLQKGGWFRSDKKDVKTAAVDDQSAKLFSDTYSKLKEVTGGFGKAIDASAGSLASLSTRAQEVNIVLAKTAAESEKAAIDFFVGVANTMAEELVPGLAAFKLEGESSSVALQRLAGDYKAVDLVLMTIGRNSIDAFGAIGVASIAARERLIAAAGGLDTLASGTAYFAQNFLSPEEQMAPIIANVKKQLADLGLAGVSTSEDFKRAVLDLASSGKLATEAGAAQYAALLQVAPQFKQMTDYLEKLGPIAGSAAAALESLKAAAATLLTNVDGALAGLQKSVTAEKSARTSAHELEMKALQKRIDTEASAVAKLTSLSSALHSTLDGMQVPGQEETDRVSAQALISQALASAKAGNALPDADALKRALSVVSRDSSSQFATSQEYLRNLYTTAGQIADLGQITDAALSIEQKTLDALIAQKDFAQKAYEDEIARLDGLLTTAQTQVDALNGINNSILTIPAALAALAASLSAAMANSVASAASAATNAYQQYLGRAPEAGAIDYWKGQAGNGVDIVNEIKNSQEARVRDLYKSLLGRAADSSGLGFWTDQLKAGTSLDQIKQAFTDSDEYKKLHPFAIGTNFVPRDMPALIHEGERIIPAADNRELLARLSNPQSNSTALVEEIRLLRQEVSEQRIQLARIADSTTQHADQFDRATGSGTVFYTEPS